MEDPYHDLVGPASFGLSYTPNMVRSQEIEFVFEPQDEGGFYVYAPDLPGLHTQGDTLEEAIANAEEALQLYVEGLREEGRPIGAGIVRRTFPVPCVSERLPVVSGAQLIRVLEQLGWAWFASAAAMSA